MNKTILSAALAGVFAAGITTSAHADDKMAATGKVKCYGVAKAGKNDCKAADGLHSCQGLAKTDNNPNDFKLVADKTSCTDEMHGKLMAPGKM